MVGRKRKVATAPAVRVEAADTPAAAVASGGGSSRRRSTRISSSSTIKKSHYFEPESESESELDTKKTSRRKSTAGANGTKKASKKAKLEPELTDEEDDYKDEEEGAADDDEPNVDDEDEEIDEDAPQKVTFIPLPKLRDTGGIEYADDRLHKNTLAFLKDLKAHNKRTWLKSHDQEYRRSLKDWESYVMTLTDKIIEADETIPELPFKDVNFRIYRDIRFTNDPTPYKSHYGAAWSRTGRKGPYACYYVHVEPGKCFVGGGLWHPDGQAVQKLRASIDERPQRWRRVLTDPAFCRTFLPDARIKGKKGGKELWEAAVLKAFAESNKENALKTKPKGFIAEHRDIELLKLRNFTVGKKVPDDIFTSEAGQEEVAEIVRAMVGFVTHLNRIVMPDPGDDDDSSDDDGE
ncbi:hypothetical protein B0H66DRAFT_294663 [Apodospora peruviana]|uniref:Uncharacterized protein n=1 Tax=Apodospora peruviana TaxID=516989 RepID=A0AAE0M3D2_9PEZI|nr:hypothetical protein B0H66DRAFT_294663 [Apodospora peruviana]